MHDIVLKVTIFTPQQDIIRKFAIESTELLNFCLCVSVLFHILACSLTPIHVLVFTIPAIFSAMKVTLG